MGMTNLRHSLCKRYSGLTGELCEVRDQIERIQRQVAKLPALETRIAELQPLIAAAELLLRDNDPDWIAPYAYEDHREYLGQPVGRTIRQDGLLRRGRARTWLIDYCLHGIIDAFGEAHPG